jgi:YegS/Rv2252/BmrU family lipid kinase
VIAQRFPRLPDPGGYIFRHRRSHYSLNLDDWGEAIAAARKTIVIYNPFAGKMGDKGLKRLSAAAEILREAGHDTWLVPTQGPGTAGAIARRSIADGAELILAAGGDGTINEIAEGVAFSDVPLGILPAGTANVLASEMGLGSSIERAAASLHECVPTRISIGRLQCVNDSERTRLFLLMAGIGLDARIVYNMSLPLKARFGKLAYWVGGFSLVGRDLDEFEVLVDGHRVNCAFALISKVRNYGGDLEIAQRVSLLDDRFEVVLFEGRSSFRFLTYLARVAVRKLAGVPGISVIRAAGVCMPGATGPRVYIQVDGEYAGHLPASVEIVPDALTLLIPEAYIRKSWDRQTGDRSQESE